MPWLQLKFDSDPAAADQVSDLLTDLGAAAVTFEDGADQPLFEPDPGETRLWDRVRVIGLFEADADLEAVTAELTQQLGERAPQKYQINPLEDKDWERAWMDNFKPIRFGERLWICPSWHTPENSGAVNVMLDPGLAFGTGTHPTTSLCLQWLDGHPPQGLEVLDYGCGSGILAIAAALLGAAHVDAVDHDPQALIATRDNAAKNNVTEAVAPLRPAELPARKYDLLLANILATPLLELAGTFVDHLKPGGRIVLSGILKEQAQTLLDHYRQWFRMDPAETQEDWVRLTGVRL